MASLQGTLRVVLVKGRAGGSVRVRGCGAECEYGVEWVVCVFDPISWSRKEDRPVDSCDAVDSLNDALDCDIRNAARWVADNQARNEVSDLPLDFDELQKEGMGPLAGC